MTRPEPGAGETAARLAAMNLRPVVAPMLNIQPLTASLPEAAALQAVLVTSSQALPMLAALMPVPLLAVGNATARRARALGFTTVFSADGDAQALAQLAEQCCAPAGLPLLLASGEGQGHALRTMLENAGFAVLHRAVYAAVPAASLPEPARQALCNGSLRAALFFSAETARVFVRLANKSSLGEQVVSIEAVAIGSEAAVALQALPWRRIRVAPKPNQDEMLALLR